MSYNAALFLLSCQTVRVVNECSEALMFSPYREPRMPPLPRPKPRTEPLTSGQQPPRSCSDSACDEDKRKNRGYAAFRDSFKPRTYTFPRYWSCYLPFGVFILGCISGILRRKNNCFFFLLNIRKQYKSRLNVLKSLIGKLEL